MALGPHGNLTLKRGTFDAIDAFVFEPNDEPLWVQSTEIEIGGVRKPSEPAPEPDVQDAHDAHANLEMSYLLDAV